MPNTLSIVGAVLIAFGAALLLAFWERQQRKFPRCGICGNTDRRELVASGKGLWLCRDSPHCLGVLTKEY